MRPLSCLGFRTVSQAGRRRRNGTISASRIPGRPSSSPICCTRMRQLRRRRRWLSGRFSSRTITSRPCALEAAGRQGPRARDAPLQRWLPLRRHLSTLPQSSPMPSPAPPARARPQPESASPETLACLHRCRNRRRCIGRAPRPWAPANVPLRATVSFVWLAGPSSPLSGSYRYATSVSRPRNGGGRGPPSPHFGDFGCSLATNRLIGSPRTQCAPIRMPAILAP